MVSRNISQVLGIIIIIAILFSFFGFTYYADADAILHLYSDVDTINGVNIKVTSAIITFTLNISNPTTRNINDLSSTFDIFIKQNKIGQGSFSGIDIPAESSVYEKVSITVYYNQTLASIWDTIVDKFQGQETTLVIKGTMDASVLFGLTKASQDFIATSS